MEDLYESYMMDVREQKTGSDEEKLTRKEHIGELSRR
jgi:hypothetical protein